MSGPEKMSGVLSPVVTPFNADLSADAGRLVRQCRWLLSQNCGLAIFGTNSEANSLSAEEKIDLLDALVDAGLDTGRMMPGTGACAIPDTVRLTSHAVKLGCGGVLMLPPFYYKGVSDEGLFRGYSEVIQRVGDSNLKVYLYHFPQVSQVPISLDLIERLLKEYPDTVVGIKDSSGDWSNMEAMLKRFPGFAMFPGNETVLLKSMQNGGAGCISATANINPGAIAALAANWQSPDAQAMQDKMNDLRQMMQQFPMIPALKAAIAHYSGDTDWEYVRPPLVELTLEQKTEMLAELDKRGFAMPGLAEAQAV
ncbi:MAG: dihydrodipicolinate synthase family protein [Alphaproteobacteria bacterium]|nr:dihydrodipicolinate synthase family protein [Alphaproteobacteria bacterium]MCK5623410.1 dihydrodipicolinate synthase family protein [Alphaproteobacteria bacterium]